ncbi:hypothetical protein JX266_002761 [Neoarthrinium moseri]|nr:hypothetical protein JX266_002761 [Neoarthrinium moseri]
MDTPKAAPKYTTVGSICKTNTAPLQAPARRGRTVKAPLHSDIVTFQGPSSAWSFGLAVQSRSPPPSAGQPLHYSPLQQNYDRAVSPAVSHASAGPDDMSRTSLLSADAANAGKHDDANISTDVQVDDNGTPNENDTLRQMSVKTLTNLASYPNPEQKNAQKMLQRARTLPLPDQSQPVNLSFESFPQKHDPRMAAPQLLPLTAGPPGLRQQKSLTIGPSSTDRQRTTVHTDMSAAQVNIFRTASAQSQYAATREPPPEPAPSSTSVKAAMSNQSKMSDTLTADEAVQYFPNGLPSNFDYTANYSKVAPDESYLEESGLWEKRPQEDLVTHRARIDELFHAGNSMLYKTIDQAITEKNHRDFQNTMGIDTTNDEESKRKVRPANPKLSIEDAIARPASDHAAPLLSMVFQTLINHPEFAQFSTLPKFHYKDY